MKKTWLALGRLAFWCCLPALALALRGSARSRVLVLCDDHVLLIKNWLGDGSWSLPGGGIHAGETSREAARRELFEETGLDLELSNLSQLGSYVFKGRWLSFPYVLFGANVKRRRTLHPQWPEIAEARWVKRKDLSGLKLGDDCQQALRSLV